LTHLGLIDSHCHLQSLEADAREAALEHARERGVRGFLVPAIHLEDAEVLLGLCERHADVWCALGVHPHEAGRWDDGSTAKLRDLAGHEKVVAVGECGLDFHYDHAPRDRQERAMRQQWELALELDLPVVVHNRESNDRMLAILREPRYRELRADFHSFAGGLAMGRELVERGCWLGVTGMITFPAADNVREVLPLVPADRLLVETDTPYLAPVPHRGRANEPAYVVEVARRLAEELGWSIDRVELETTHSFFGLFTRALTPL
jgi:TatD DNase family protein